jgi:hypothetical protein
MATETASIEKIVRKVLDEELEQRNEATLEAIERMTRVLTEEVIPRLPEDEDATYDEEEPAGNSGRTRAMRAGRAQSEIDDPTDESDISEDEDEPPLQTIPGAIREVFEALYASLTAEQADALAELFAAIAEDPADEADEPEAPPAERPTHRPPRPKARLAA